MRRQARGWVVTVNTIAITLPTAMFLIGALITSRGIPEVLRYSLGGLGAGTVLGLIGFALTRWESSGPLHAESLTRADRDDLRRSAHLLWCLARVGRVAGWCRADRSRGAVPVRNVDRGWRGRARLLLDLLDRHPSSSSIFAHRLTDGSNEADGCADSA